MGADKHQRYELIKPEITLVPGLNFIVMAKDLESEADQEELVDWSVNGLEQENEEKSFDDSDEVNHVNEGEPDQELWLLDTGATIHVTYNDKYLTNLFSTQQMIRILDRKI